MRTSSSCASVEITTQLASGLLSGSALAEAEGHLETCESCLAHFRELTAERFPRFRGYTILSQLGRGGFGVVYKAFHHAAGRVEALKVLSAKTPLRAAYFENEIRLVARLRHPNIATLYDAHLTSSPLYFAMEYVNGRHLEDYLSSRVVSIEQRLWILRQVADAVGYAHGEGVVHRDLKPQNILIDAQGQPRIIDFGIAKRFGPERSDESHAPLLSPGGILGTYGYIAPEQLAHQPVDMRADIYALGVLLFHVVTGQPAKFAREVGRLRELLRGQHVARAADLAAIIAHCVHADPARRFATARELVEDLDRYVAGAPVRARGRASIGYWLARLAAVLLHRHPAPVACAAAVATAGACIAALWNGQARYFPPPVEGQRTALIAVMPSTVEAIASGQFAAALPELSASDAQSWRLLYGQLMERLAAARPRVVAWDFFFRVCRPEYDEAMVRGMRSLGAPVILAARELDVDGEPDLCPAIRGAAHAYGTALSQRLDWLATEVTIPLAVVRGFNAPILSLPVAALGAYRHPTSQAGAVIHADHLALRYRKTGATAGQSRWHPVADRIPIFASTTATARHELLEPNDVLALGRFPLRSVAAWGERAVPLEHVLAMDEAALRHHFADRAVLVGRMTPGLDQYRLRDGTHAYGCQVQAAALDALLDNLQVERIGRVGLVGRVAIGTLAGGIIALAPLRTRRRPGWEAAKAAALAAMGPVMLLAVATWVKEPAAIEPLILIGSAVAGWGAVRCVRYLSARESQLAPPVAAGAAPTPTPATATVLVATRGSDVGSKSSDRG